jgi:adenylosuccinate lyase
MSLNQLTTISPVDGRYRDKTVDLHPYFSEYALIKYRVQVEVEYFIALREVGIPSLNGVKEEVYERLRSLYLDFNVTDAEQVKKIERVTNHDVKAVEYFLKERFNELGLEQYKEFIHFGSPRKISTIQPCR